MENLATEKNIFQPNEKLVAFNRVTNGIFNAIRNYLICYSLILAGKKANLDPDLSFFGNTILVIGTVLAFLYSIYWVLCAINNKKSDVSEEEAKEILDNFYLFLKRIFDHFRNYILCATLFVASNITISNSDFLATNTKIAATTMFILLVVLNGIYFSTRIWTIFDPEKLIGSSRGQTLRMILLLIYILVVYVLVRFTISIKIE